MPFLPHGPWATPYTNLNVHGNILSLHIFVLISMLLPINSPPFFTFLDAPSHLYKRVYPSVRPLVRPPVIRRAVGP